MSSDFNGDRRPRRSSADEEPVEARKYLDVVWRSKWIVLAIAIALTVLVVAVSLVLPKSYQSTAKVVVDNTASTLGTSDVQAVQRELATTQQLVTTTRVLEEAAATLPGETADSLRSHVSATVDPAANIIAITATADTAADSARLAAAVVAAFVAQQAIVQRERIARAQTALNDEITQLRAQPATDPDARTQLEALQARIAELSVASASAGSELQLVQAPEVPDAPSSPQPVRNGVLALFAGLFVGVLVVLGIDQLRPRIRSQRDLSRLMRLPVLAGIPYVRRRSRARDARAEYETYQTLSAALRLAVPPGQGTQVILVTSGVHGEGKTIVTTKLGRLLARAGHNTLLVSADLRFPKLDATFEVQGMSGMRDLLADAYDQVSADALAERIVVAPSNGPAARAHLEILPAGRQVGDPSNLLTTEALRSLFDVVRTLDYAYVLVDSPPMLGVADAQILARHCDETLLVASLDSLSLNEVIDMRELLDRVGIEPVGMAVIGARVADSPYYTDMDTSAITA